MQILAPMYAVIETGGKQYRVQLGEIIQVEKISTEMGQAVNFENVLLLGKQDGENSQIWLGKPNVMQASVSAEVVGDGRGKKILIVKMKRRKQYRRTKGHRQPHSQLLITGIDNGTGEKVTLSADDRKTRLSRFQSSLKQKPAMSVTKN